MRINFYSLKINLVSGGGSHHTLDLKLRYLLTRGHEVSLTTLYAGENKFATAPPYPVRECGFTGGFLEMQKYLRDRLKQDESGADIFHIDGQSFIWGAGMYKNDGGKIPTLAFINNYTAGMGIAHKDDQGLKLIKRFNSRAQEWLYSQKRYLWEKFVGLRYANQLDRIFFDSPVIKQIYADYGFDKNKLAVLPEFVNTQALKNTPLSDEAPFHKKNGLHLLYIGRLTFDKGVDLAIAALNDLSNKNIFLNIVGDGPQKNYLLKLIKNHRLENRVSLYPWKSQEQLAQFIYHSDVLLHPCRWPEPFGRTIVEAMTFGKPVLTAARSGSAWAMGPGGLTFKNGNLADLRSRLSLFLDNKDLLPKLSGQARIRAAQLDYKTYAAEFENYLLKFLP